MFSKCLRVQLESRLAVAMIVGRYRLQKTPRLPYSTVEGFADHCKSALHLWHRDGVHIQLQPRAPAASG